MRRPKNQRQRRAGMRSPSYTPSMQREIKRKKQFVHLTKMLAFPRANRQGPLRGELSERRKQQRQQTANGRSEKLEGDVHTTSTSISLPSSRSTVVMLDLYQTSLLFPFVFTCCHPFRSVSRPSQNHLTPPARTRRYDGRERPFPLRWHTCCSFFSTITNFILTSM